MKLDRLVGDRFKEKPADCVIDSHALMLRGGYMKAVASGIYSSYTPLTRIMRKIEDIIRDEMDALGGQEVCFPVVLPASLWRESGRYEGVGSELARFSDRNDNPLVLGMTHEEAAVQLVRDCARSYTKYPFMVYQIQTKFRDEARPRGGLIRVREFTMKDAYSFHTSQQDLEEFYNRCIDAYRRIFTRAGIPEVVTVKSDSGMMGGNVSHEFMLLTPVGEDSIALCSECDYRANTEAAASAVQSTRDAVSEPLRLVKTPGCHTIDEVCAFLSLPKEKSCKAVVYREGTNGRIAVLFIRGDLEVNETKLSNFLRSEIRPADITAGSGLAASFIGPYGLEGDFDVLFDKSLENANNLCCGGNVDGYHYTGLDAERDLSAVSFHDFAKIAEGGVCPKCGKPSIRISRGIEVGNIFQLGTKYTEPMNMRYLDRDGTPRCPVMGCYGIGVDRLAASVCEARHDEHGPVWPMAIAPWQVHICAVRPDDASVREYADKLYTELEACGIEVIYDDRAVSAGVMFSDADLLGVPLRVVVSPRNIGENCCELAARDKSFKLKVPLGAAVPAIREKIEALKG